MAALDVNANSTIVYSIDIVSAIGSALAVAPFIAIIDQAVTEKAYDGNKKLFPSALSNFKSLFTNPVRFLTKPTFAFVCIVYGSTYIAANTITSYCELNRIDSFWYKLLGTTVVNMGFGITKDRYFAKVFNKSSPPVFPLISWALFFGRDLLTIGAAFSFPSYASTFLQNTNIIPAKKEADNFSQIIVPVTAQLVLTPIHLLSLDIYNRANMSLFNRFSYIKGIFPEVVSIRMGRVLCAYSIAGVNNKNMRESLRAAYL